MTPAVGWSVLFAVLIALLGCEGRDEPAPSDELPPAKHESTTRDAGAVGDPMPPAVDEQPSEEGLDDLCPSCAPQSLPGGDTTDFGGGRAPPACRGTFHQEMVSLDDADGGVDLRAELSGIEGEHSFAVRWTLLDRAAPTTLTVELHATGRAQLETWPDSPNAPRDLPSCPDDWNRVLPEVEVRVTTGDHGVEGVFTGLLATREAPPRYPWEVVWDRGYPSWVVTGDGSALRGNLDAPAEPQTLAVSVSALDGGDKLGARGGITLVWRHFVAPGLMDGSGGWANDRAYYAVPLDGCETFMRFVDDAPCPRVGCCEEIGERLAYELGGADEDAGPDAP